MNFSHANCLVQQSKHLLCWAAVGLVLVFTSVCSVQAGDSKRVLLASSKDLTEAEKNEAIFQFYASMESFRIGNQEDCFLIRDHLSQIPDSEIPYRKKDKLIKEVCLAIDANGNKIDTSNSPILFLQKVKRTKVPKYGANGLQNLELNGAETINAKDKHMGLPDLGSSVEQWQDCSRDLRKNTTHIVAMSLAVSSVFYALPEENSGWSSDVKHPSKFAKQWKEHVKEGPVSDEDSGLVNYIMHPYAGATYYLAARQAGCGPMVSFAYTVTMSTLYWEYGVEAFMEPPSKQDLLITPLVGAPLGELFYRWKKRIEKNNGEVLGSKSMGSFVMRIIDPYNTGKSLVNSVMRKVGVKDYQLKAWIEDHTDDGDEFRTGRELWLGIEFIF